MPNEITPDANGVVSFRKSLFDDDGDTINIVSIQVTKKNGASITASQPAWLTYTTSTEQTTEGPKSSRRYVHIDFSIDSQHTDIDDGASYTIRITATDGENPNKVFHVLYTNGYFDFASVSGLKLWLSARKDDPIATYPTDYSPESQSITSDSSSYRPDYNSNIRDGRPAWQFGSSDRWFINGDVFPTSDAGNPDAPNYEPIHAFLVLQRNDSIYHQYFEVNGTDRFLGLFSDFGDLEMRRDYPGIGFTRTTSVPSRQTQFLLLEYHRDATGRYSVVIDGTERFFGNDDASFGTELIIGRGIRSGGPMYFFEALFYQHDLTQDQITQIRESLKGLYPSLPFTVA